MYKKRSAVTDIEMTLLSYATMVLLSAKTLEQKKRRLEDIRSHLKSEASKRMFAEDIKYLD
jgi:heme exporter protein D